MSNKVSLRERWYWWKQDRAAKKRGQVRVVPVGVRGRVYANKDGQRVTAAGDDHKSRVRPTAKLTMVITRKDGTVEEVTVPATLKEQFNG